MFLVYINIGVVSFVIIDDIGGGDDCSREILLDICNCGAESKAESKAEHMYHTTTTTDVAVYSGCNK